MAMVYKAHTQVTLNSGMAAAIHTHDGSCPQPQEDVCATKAYCNDWNSQIVRMCIASIGMTRPSPWNAHVSNLLCTTSPYTSAFSCGNHNHQSYHTTLSPPAPLTPSFIQRGLVRQFQYCNAISTGAYIHLTCWMTTDAYYRS